MRRLLTSEEVLVAAIGRFVVFPAVTSGRGALTLAVVPLDVLAVVVLVAAFGLAAALSALVAGGAFVLGGSLALFGGTFVSGGAFALAATVVAFPCAPFDFVEWCPQCSLEAPSR